MILRLAETFPSVLKEHGKQLFIKCRHGYIAKMIHTVFNGCLGLLDVGRQVLHKASPNCSKAIWVHHFSGLALPLIGRPQRINLSRQFVTSSVYLFPASLIMSPLPWNVTHHWSTKHFQYKWQRLSLSLSTRFSKKQYCHWGVSASDGFFSLMHQQCQGSTMRTSWRCKRGDPHFHAMGHCAVLYSAAQRPTVSHSVTAWVQKSGIADVLSMNVLHLVLRLKFSRLSRVL